MNRAQFSNRLGNTAQVLPLITRAATKEYRIIGSRAESGYARLSMAMPKTFAQRVRLPECGLRSNKNKYKEICRSRHFAHIGSVPTKRKDQTRPLVIPFVIVNGRELRHHNECNTRTILLPRTRVPRKPMIPDTMCVVTVC